MLKIKDSVDLKELEKFGFEKVYSEKTGKIKRYEKFVEEDGTSGVVAKIYYVDNDHCNKPYFEISFLCHSTTLYDLIKADMVEKVEG